MRSSLIDWKQYTCTNHREVVYIFAERLEGLWGNTYDNISCNCQPSLKSTVDCFTCFKLHIRFVLHRLDESECAAMENLSEDGFETWEKFGDWSTGSSEHWNEDHIDNSDFGDWASFKEGLSEVRSLAISSLLSQEGQMPDNHDRKVICILCLYFFYTIHS